jgi:Putative Flp pilus-assembly TadE/G-like
MRRSLPHQCRASRQRGQALIFGLFVLISGLAALFFFFNVGQLAREKTKLVNTADAVAYSAGVIHARALNFNAYSNRALIANEMLIAQMVSLASWAGYVESWANNLPAIHPECVAAAQGNWVGAAGLIKFGPDYLLGCALFQQASQNDLVQPVVDTTREAIPRVIKTSEGNKDLIQIAQKALNPAGATLERKAVMTAVANANYQGDGSVSVDLLSPTLPDDWTRMRDSSNRVTPFVRQYPDNERTRFREVTVSARNTDNFLRERRWTSRSLLPEPSCLSVLQWRQNEVRRRGGTELLGFDEWQAVDTQSFHQYFRRKSRCRQREIPTGVAGEESFKADQSPGAASFGRSRNDNRAAHFRALSASTGSAAGYSGLPHYYDLNQIWLKDRPEDEPRLLYGVRLTRNRTELRTTDGNTGQIRTQANSRIGAYKSAVAGDVMAAASASEVFFERPPGAGINRFGGTTRPRELGSLFNPYWQVRLTASNAVSEWTRQGVTPTN